MSGGNNSTATLALNGAAPSGGSIITLQSSNTSVAQVSPTVTIPAKSTSTTFTITTSGVAAQTSVTLSGVDRTTKTTTLTVNPPSLSSLTLNPSTVTGGASSRGTLTLDGAAPPSGAVVSLKSSNPNVAQVPSSTTIPVGSNGVIFAVTRVRSMGPMGPRRRSPAHTAAIPGVPRLRCTSRAVDRFHAQVTEIRMTGAH